MPRGRHRRVPAQEDCVSRNPAAVRQQQWASIKIQPFSNFLPPHQGVALMWHCCMFVKCFLSQVGVDLSALISGLPPWWLSASSGQSALVTVGAGWGARGLWQDAEVYSSLSFLGGPMQALCAPQQEGMYVVFGGQALASFLITVWRLGISDL